MMNRGQVKAGRGKAEIVCSKIGFAAGRWHTHDEREMRKTVLIIDDSQAVREHVKAVLEQRKVFDRILTASDGIAGFKQLLDNAVQLVLCDLMMPTLDGFKFLSLKQAKPELAEIPVIMLTGHEDSRAKIKGLEAGAADYLLKPFDDEELVARVRVHLKLKILQDELRDKNKRLEELSNTDSLTLIANRRHLLATLDSEWRRAARYRTSLACVMTDLDLFKPINDRFGHPVGDMALAAVAGVLRQGLRDSDMVGRYGGEEFMLVLPQTNSEGATAVAERCRRGIERLVLAAGDGTFTISASFGVAATPHPEIARVDDLIRLADEALYRAKQAGRNRVEAAR